MWFREDDTGTVRLYFHYMKISINSQLQYRTSVILQSIGMFFINGIEFLGVYALFSRFGSLRGWTLPQVALFYGLINIVFAVADAFSRGFDQMSNLVRMGDFDRYLLRPRSTILQILGYEFTLRRFGRLTQGTAVLVYGWIMLRPDPVNLLVLAWAAVCGICLFTGIIIIQAAITIWTVETLEIMNIFTYGGVQTANYPLSIYHNVLQKFFLFVVPIGMISYMPVCAVLGREPLPGLSPLFGYFAPAAGILFLLLTLQFWKTGVRHYCSTGS